MAHSAIRKQMKWQPSCRRGSSRWSYESVVPHEDVFFAAFELEKGDKKAWKQKKMSLKEFQDVVGELSANVGGILHLVSIGYTLSVEWLCLRLCRSGTAP